MDFGTLGETWGVAWGHFGALGEALGDGGSCYDALCCVKSFLKAACTPLSSPFPPPPHDFAGLSLPRIATMWLSATAWMTTSCP
jgi:hypothetical protein